MIYVLLLVWVFDTSGSFAEVPVDNIDYSLRQCKEHRDVLNTTKGDSTRSYECRPRKDL